MTATRRQALSLLAAIPATLALRPAFADTDAEAVVHVKLWDKGVDAMNAFDTSKPMMMGTPGAAMIADAPMGITADPKKVPAGEVRFEVTNTSAAMEHEMIVVPVADTSQPLPYNADDAQFDEDAAGALGEVPETEPGESGTLVLHLDPGTYLLACNIPGHYAMGMWTLITVT